MSPFADIRVKTAQDSIKHFEVDGHETDLKLMPIQFRLAAQSLSNQFKRIGADTGYYIHPGSNAANSSGNFRTIVTHQGKDHVLSAFIG